MTQQANINIRVRRIQGEDCLITTTLSTTVKELKDILFDVRPY
jgi:hypothetical protein